MTVRTLSAAPSRAAAEVRIAAAVALAIGTALVFLTGFAHPDLLHNAAHDWRHSMSFPCH